MDVSRSCVAAEKEMGPKINIDIEDLIVKVQEHPALYDKANEDYKKTNKKNKIWRVISMELFVEDWPLWSEEQKEDTVAEMKNKWRHVRDNFAKEVKLERKEQRSGSGRSKRQPYKHTAIMAFLRPCLEMRLTQDNITFSSDDDSILSMDTSEKSRRTEELDTEVDLTQELIEDTEGTSDSAGRKTSRKTTDSRGKKMTKKSKEEDLMTSLKTCMTVIKGKEQPMSEAQSLAQSLIPLLERVPASNMFGVRHALLDAIYAHIPSASGGVHHVAEVPSTACLPPPTIIYREQPVVRSSTPIQHAVPHSGNVGQSMHAQYLQKYSLKPAHPNVPTHAEVQRTYQQYHLQSSDNNPQQTQLKKQPQSGTVRPQSFPPRRSDSQSGDSNFQYMSSSYSFPDIIERPQTYETDTNMPSFLQELRSGCPSPQNLPNRSVQRNTTPPTDYTQAQQGFQQQDSNAGDSSASEGNYFTDL